MKTIQKIAQTQSQQNTATNSELGIVSMIWSLHHMGFRFSPLGDQTLGVYEERTTHDRRRKVAKKLL